MLHGRTETTDRFGGHERKKTPHKSRDWGEKKCGGGRPKRQSQASGIIDTGTKEEIPEIVKRTACNQTHCERGL